MKQGVKVFWALLIVMVMMGCAVTKENPSSSGSGGSSGGGGGPKNGKNLILHPPFGVANPYVARNMGRVFVRPAGYDTWRYDLDGDGTWDVDWSTTTMVTQVYTTSGTVHPRIVVSRSGEKVYFTNNTLLVVGGTGTGHFTEVSSSLTGVGWSSIALGDIDNDGDLDLILTGKYYNSWWNDFYVSKVYLNDGSGVFIEDSRSSLTGVSDSSIALGDIDNDGDLDLILTGSYYEGSYHYVSEVYLNDGSGVFIKDSRSSLTGVGWSSIALGDIDNDGDLDLILTGWMGSQVSKVYTNNGSGVFSEDTRSSLTGVSDSSIALGDIDNDGDLDLIITGYSSSDPFSKVYLNDGSGVFSEDSRSSLTAVGYSSIALGDIDNDGDLDLILTGDTGSGRVSKIYRNDP